MPNMKVRPSLNLNHRCQLVFSGRNERNQTTKQPNHRFEILQTMLIRTFILILILASASLTAQAGQLVANGLVEEDSVSSQMVKSMFLGSISHWQDGKPISLCLVNSDKSAVNTFLKTQVGKNDRSYKRHWTRRVFSGDASTMPRSFKDTNKALKYLANKEGAVCFIGALDGPLPSGTKKLNAAN